jgi:hypothetical protein
MDKLKDAIYTMMVATLLGVAGASFQLYTDMIEIKQNMNMLIDSDGDIRPSHRVLILEDRVNRLDCFKPSTELMLL